MSGPPMALHLIGPFPCIRGRAGQGRARWGPTLVLVRSLRRVLCASRGRAEVWAEWSPPRDLLSLAYCLSVESRALLIDFVF